MGRIDKERQEELEPKRMAFAVNAITFLGYEIQHQDKTKLQFEFNGSTVTFYPYSGWHTGKTINDGRGIEKLINQIKTK